MVEVSWWRFFQNRKSLDFDYLKSRQMRWYTSEISQTNLAQGIPPPKLVCCEAWWLRNNNMNDVVNKHRDKPKDIITVPKKEIFIVLPYLGIQSKIVTQQLKSRISKFYGCFNPKIIFRNTRRNKSFFPNKDRLGRSLKSKVVYRASCWDCEDCYIGKTNFVYMTGKRNISRRLRVTAILLPLLITWPKQATRLNGISLTF